MGCVLGQPPERRVAVYPLERRSPRLARSGAGCLTMAGILFYDLASIPHLGFWQAETTSYNFLDQESTP